MAPRKSWLARVNPFVDWMDFEGQVLSERLYQGIIVVPSIVGFVHGYVAGRFEVTFYYWLGASLLAALITVPSWPPLFQRHAITWADETDALHKAPPLRITTPAAAAAAAASSGGAGAAAGKPQQQQAQPQQAGKGGKR